MLNHFHSFVSVAAVVVVAATVAPAQADGTVMFNYQGRVKVQGNKFNGNGQFKFAIVSPSGENTLWSSDGTSIDGSEPTTGLTLPVTDGVFNVLMGANGVMEPINSTVFQTKKALKLRTWFSDGINGFERLRPDHNLVNTNLIASETGGEDFTIYVNGQTGDDSNSGLKPNQAKKTIQGAVDIVPARVMANLTIDVADGSYPEEVLLYGINVKPGKTLKIVGDEIWTPSSGGIPAVTVSGADGATTGVRSFGIHAVQCTGLSVEGMCLENVSRLGIQVENGNYAIKNCVTRLNGYGGVLFANQVRGSLENHISESNLVHGIGVTNASTAYLYSCKSNNNSGSGLYVSDNSGAALEVTGEFSFNKSHGILCIASSQVGVQPSYKNGKVQNNGGYGFVAGWDGYYSNWAGNSTVTGNTSGVSFAFNGGQLGY